MNLTKVRPFITSAALVQTVHINGSSTYKEIPRGVYYTGHVTSDPGSLVAINENNGLAGMIRTLNDTFYINPLPSHVIRSIKFNAGQPHVIYRRSIEDLSSTYHISEDGEHRIKRAKPNRHRRQKRDAPHKYLEMALVADNFAISAYGEDEMTFHLLAIAHISACKPVRHFYFFLSQFGYDSSSSRTERIKAMESWAKENFPHSDSDPDHADAVVLITRRSSGGIASLGSTCRDVFGAALSNDIGLGSALVLTHELAHTMGVGHDGSSSGCANHINLMASTIPIGPGSMKWSACSRERFQDFLSQRSNCLDDIPPISEVIQDAKEFYGKLPGQVINRDEQCEMAFGGRFYACPQRLTSCQALGCTEDGQKCYFSPTSPVDGTRCGDRHWCINGQCTDDGSRVINGRWSNWSVFTKCTRPCGGGVQSRTRTCTNPVPKNGGKNCIGPAEGHWRICNPKPCPAGSKSFRQLQCEEIDPDYSEYLTSDECLLTCRKGKFAYPQHRPVKDGTRCTNDPTIKDICIQGKCRVR
ncbi:A disintegrin and metalloproteinase with thrombospondin motifs 6-like [Orbicella faveolata]|uniref:A disintegrin and metalloproteinase with thrombospondin motifs 6-like n=1 Tax=Orbicella faveolata TaxID=48498 RepID=UPI0009E62CBD|nr:A disintegrin and metalloproteinase with thrombospondin motifs 6-like [Orbicella faveolata]